MSTIQDDAVESTRPIFFAVGSSIISVRHGRVRWNAAVQETGAIIRYLSGHVAYLELMLSLKANYKGT